MYHHLQAAAEPVHAEVAPPAAAEGAPVTVTMTVKTKLCDTSLRLLDFGEAHRSIGLKNIGAVIERYFDWHRRVYDRYDVPPRWKLFQWHSPTTGAMMELGIVEIFKDREWPPELKLSRTQLFLGKPRQVSHQAHLDIFGQ